MDYEGHRREGRIFPELHDDGRGFARQSEGSAEDWREQPLTHTREPYSGEHRRPVEMRESRKNSTSSLWLAFSLLLVVLAGATLFGYRTLQEQNIQVSRIPTLLKSMTTANGRMDNLEDQLKAWSQNWQGLSGQVDKLEKRVSVGYRSARRHAEALTAKLHKQIEIEMAARDRVVNARLDQLTSAQRSSEEREARLQQQLSDTRQEIAALRQETDGDLALLHQHVAGNEQQVNNLSRQVERERVDFELTRNQITELSPDITMDLLSTNVAYQRFSGWVYFEPDRRYLWVRDQGVAQPVVFYDRQRARQYQLIVTGLHQDSATGYLLLPSTDAELSSDVVVNAPAGQ